MQNPSLFFTAPRTVEILDRPLPSPGAGEVLIRARRSLISTGTELTLFRGEARPGSVWEEISQYPQPIGYSHVGEVVETGEGVDSRWLGRRVDTHSFHAAFVTSPVDQLRALPEGTSDDDATFATLAEVAMNGLRRARLEWGESVAVFGLGIVGQLTARLAAAAGAGPVFGIERAPGRLARLPASPFVHPLEAAPPQALRAMIEARNDGRRADLVIETTANADLIPDEIELVRDQGRLLMLSSPRGATRFDFHDLCNRRSLAIVGAHGFSHPKQEWPDYPWTGKRHGDLFLSWLATGRITVSELVSHHFSHRDAAEAYRLLDERREEALGVVLTWD